MSLKKIRSYYKNHSLQTIFVATVIIIAIGTVFYHFVENLRWIDALYFSVVTLTTVGFGDFTPQTDIGKLFTLVYILNGIAIIMAFINAFYKHRLSGNKKSKVSKEDT